MKAMGLALVALVGCGPEFDRLVLTPENQPPADVRVSSEPLRIAAGNVQFVTVEPTSENDQEYDSSTEIALESDDEAVFDVLVGARKREFALVGVAPGSTCMHVELDGDHVDCIDVDVD